MTDRYPARPPPGPRADPGRPAQRLRRATPSKVVRSSALEATEDIMAIIHREVSRFKAQTMLSPADVRSLLDLARTAKEARQLEQLVEADLEDELAKEDDAALKQRAGMEDGNE